MSSDPIVEEVRRIREEYVKSHAYDIDSIFRDLKSMQTSSNREYIKLPPRSAAKQTSDN